MHFGGGGILLDIEGTTSSITFVYDVLFPFARRHLATAVSAHWQNPEYIAAFEALARDGGHESLEAWLQQAGLIESGQSVVDRSFNPQPERSEGAGKTGLEGTFAVAFGSGLNDFGKSGLSKHDDAQHAVAAICAEVTRLMDADAKTTGLKQLQGLIWQAGFESGELEAHVYDDVPPALAAWNQAGKDVRIYSSGSIQAQKLFFGHTIAGNLLPLLRGHYDTTIGPKKAADSYRAIAAEFALPAAEILFLSDVVAELDAARAAGLATALVVRPGNATGQVSTGQPHEQIENFAQVEI